MPSDATATAPPPQKPSGRPAGAVLARLVRSWRLFVFYSAAVLLTGIVSLMFADLLWRTGWTGAKLLLLAVFIILFFLIAIGCVHGLTGFLLRGTAERRRITNPPDFRNRSIDHVTTAIVVPMYNESAARVCEGLRATYKSLEAAGQLRAFDFFLLSDSDHPDRWVEEECRWYELVRELNALGRIYYRRRIRNEGRKSGNIRDFLRSWGSRYRYFIVFDADSLMRGDTLVDLVKLMETNPGVGMIQTVPGLVNATSLFGRIQQFSNRLYAPIFITGLNFWAQGIGNYWGHNAIIRTEPFMHYCDLPHLPGRKPFGGQILSHDFVEAALMLKENWMVWFAYDLPGSYEEGPQDMISNAQRDRRWCQGNLQHAMVLFARGLRGTSRIHLMLGIMGYLASPLWLLFLLTFAWILVFKEYTGLSDITVSAFTPFLLMTGMQHAFLIFAICMGVIFLPKILALVDLALEPERSRAFGGVRKAILSAILETAFSTLHAPLQMLWHSNFVATILLGIGIHWGPQRRTADGLTWATAARAHSSHTLIGLLWGAAVWFIDHPSFWWFAPVAAGMVLSIPLSVLTSRSHFGTLAQKWGVWLTPEEVDPPPELTELRERLRLLDESGEGAPHPPHSGLTDAVLDPYANAIHVSLLREAGFNPIQADRLRQMGIGEPGMQELAQRALSGGPAALNLQEQLKLMTDADAMSRLHRQVWLLPAEKLASDWQNAMRRLAR
jgi:membrane glycosyltransferase